MVFCRHCGKQYQFEDMSYCPACGRPQQIYRQQEGKVMAVPIVATQTKDPGAAVLISLVAGIFGFQGIGHIYLEKVAKGLGLLLFGWISYIAVIVFLFSGNLSMAILIAAGIFILWIWQSYDAYNLAKYYNDSQLRMGRAPW